MKWLIISGLIFAAGLEISAQPEKQCDLYVGTFTSEGAEGVYHCSFNSVTGDLTEKQVFKGMDNPNFLKKSADGRFLYVVSRPPQPIEPSGGTISSYRIVEDGSLAFINKQLSHGDDPCYVDVTPDGKYVAVSNYGTGSVALFPVNEDGSLQPASFIDQHEGSGPNSARQAQAHAHSIRFSGNSGLVYSADLGTDKLYAYALDRANNKLVPSSPANALLPPGSGPRHFDFPGDRKYCYVANELISSITVYRNDQDKMTEIQTISTLPADFKGVSYCADIHLSGDGKLVYVSNRGHNSIAVFNRTAEGKLSLMTTVSTHGNWPRNFAFDPSGKYMLVANQRSHNIVVFSMENGIPVYTGKELALPAPVCLEFK